MAELNRIPVQSSDTNYHPRPSLSICGEPFPRDVNDAGNLKWQ
jgi:hypothetical protein